MGFQLTAILPQEGLFKATSLEKKWASEVEVWMALQGNNLQSPCLPHVPCSCRLAHFTDEETGSEAEHLQSPASRDCLGSEPASQLQVPRVTVLGVCSVHERCGVLGKGRWSKAHSC